MLIMKNKKQVISNIPKILTERGMDLKAFTRQCIVADVCSADTARKVFNGVVNLNLDTAAGICLMLEIPLQDAFTLPKVTRGHSPRLQVPA